MSQRWWCRHRAIHLPLSIRWKMIISVASSPRFSPLDAISTSSPNHYGFSNNSYPKIPWNIGFPITKIPQRRFTMKHRVVPIFFSHFIVHNLGLFWLLKISGAPPRSRNLNIWSHVASSSYGLMLSTMFVPLCYLLTSFYAGNEKSC